MHFSVQYLVLEKKLGNPKKYFSENKLLAQFVCLYYMIVHLKKLVL